MARGVGQSLVGSVVLAALIAAAGCSHYMIAERPSVAARGREQPASIREIGREESPGAGAHLVDQRARHVRDGLSAPVSALGESVPLSYTDQPILPPGSIPSGAMPERWPVIQSSPLPPPQSDPEDSEPPPGEPPQYGQAPYPQSPYSQQPYSQQPYGQPQYGAPQTPQYNPPQYGTPPAGAPVSLAPPYPTAERPSRRIRRGRRLRRYAARRSRRSGRRPRRR